MHDYRSLGGALSFLLLKLSGSPGNKLLYVLLYNPASEMDPKHSELWAPDHLQAFFSKLIIVLNCYRFDYRLVDVEDFIFETSLQLSGQLLSAPIIVFFGGALSFLNKSLMLRMLCDPSLLNWLTLVLTVSHIELHAIVPFMDQYDGYVPFYVIPCW